MFVIWYGHLMSLLLSTQLKLDTGNESLCQSHIAHKWCLESSSDWLRRISLGSNKNTLVKYRYLTCLVILLFKDTSLPLEKIRLPKCKINTDEGNKR